MRDDGVEIASKWLIPLLAIAVTIMGGTLTFALNAIERVSHVERDQAASRVLDETHKENIRDISRRIDRTEERINGIHQYISALPVRPGNFIPGLNRRGELSPIIK